MDGHRNLEGEIESLLAVEPSPEFLARVRTRVAQEPEPGRWRLSWMVAAATTVAAVVVALIAWPSPDVTPSSHPPLEPARLAKATEPAAPAASSAAPIRTRQGARAAVPAAVPVRAIDIDLPEVMPGENEVNAYTALVVSIRQRRFDVVVPTAPDPSAPIEVKELPPVEPLEIEPIVRLATLE
jgi:hypothetical protein